MGFGVWGLGCMARLVDFALLDLLLEGLHDRLVQVCDGPAVVGLG